MKNEREIKDLLDRYENGQCSPEEELQLNLWFHQEANESNWKFDGEDQETGDALKRGIDQRISATKQPKRLYWYKFAAAAVILVSLTAGLLTYFRNSPSSTSQNGYVNNDIKPGDNKAILTLADGSMISLTDAGKGKLATQSGIAITKSADGQLIYTVISTQQAKIKGQVEYNTISTPRGGQHTVNLPDGTTVWLNSASSLKFPVSFIGLNERQVELTGEAYFEVASNKRQPFKVSSANQVVEVLGTHFNVMAYPNESNIETTLLEGKVSVKVGHKENFITPGQQIQLRAGQMSVIKDADLDDVVAWKNQLFQFDNTDIEKVLRQIERWYDVDVVYVGDKPKVSFTGVVPRNVNVSRILKALEQTCGVNFEITGRSITISKHKTNQKT